MTFAELVCAIWLFGMTGAASTVAWVDAARALQAVVAQQTADDVADNAAELWVSGGVPASTDVGNGDNCRVGVMEEAGPFHVDTEITAVCGQASQTLWLPRWPQVHGT